MPSIVYREALSVMWQLKSRLKKLPNVGDLAFSACVAYCIDLLTLSVCTKWLEMESSSISINANYVFGHQNTTYFKFDGI